MKTYSVNEVFYSLQGEGLRAGTPNLFVRFAGCNLTCKRETHGFDCDTEFTGGRSMTADEIVLVCQATGGKCLNIILTGGEPLLQVDADLIAKLKDAHYSLAVETNGTQAVPAGWFEWVTVSPKVAEHALVVHDADEVKYVLHDGQALPKSRVRAGAYLVSPACGPDGFDPKTLAWCIEQVKAHPSWRLSLQQHKLWGIR